MAIRKNKSFCFVALLVATATCASAQNYDALSRSDGISLSAGDASRANIAIQTPTPWPYYINLTDIESSGKRAADLMELYLNKFQTAAPSSSGVTINVTQPAP